jgi:hypothetical protein
MLASKGEMGETIMFHIATLTVRTRQNLSVDAAWHALQRSSGELRD